MVSGERVYQVRLTPVHFDWSIARECTLILTAAQVENLQTVLFELTDMDVYTVTSGNGRVETDGPQY